MIVCNTFGVSPGASATNALSWCGGEGAVARRRPLCLGLLPFTRELCEAVAAHAVVDMVEDSVALPPPSAAPAAGSSAASASSVKPPFLLTADEPSSCISLSATSGLDASVAPHTAA